MDPRGLLYLGVLKFYYRNNKKKLLFEKFFLFKTLQSEKQIEVSIFVR